MWLGHSSFSTTANIYAHIDVDSKMEAANMIASEINLGEFPEKRNLPSEKLLRRKAPLVELVRQNQRKINPFCLPNKKYLSGKNHLGTIGAGDGGRTHTVSPPTDFESAQVRRTWWIF